MAIDRAAKTRLRAVKASSYFTYDLFRQAYFDLQNLIRAFTSMVIVFCCSSFLKLRLLVGENYNYKDTCGPASCFRNWWDKFYLLFIAIPSHVCVSNFSCSPLVRSGEYMKNWKTFLCATLMRYRK